MDRALVDLRDTFRTIRRDPLHAMAVVATLALTLGASTAIFSIVNGVMLKPLAYGDPQRLVSIREVNPGARRYSSLPVNGRHFEEWRSRATSFDAIAELESRTTNVTGTGEPAQIVIVRASGSLFDVLQMPVALGRTLTRDDERRERPLVTVISQRLWEDRLGRDPNVLGRPLTLGGTQYTIVGVLSPGAELPKFELLGESASVASALDAVVPFRLNLSNIGWMGQFNYAAIARLKPAVSIESARAELNVVQLAVAEIATRETHEQVALRGWIAPLEESIVGRARLGLLLLLGAIGGVVLIACANLANLSLTRALGRMRDAAVKSALGASRSRLVAGIVLEQLVLAAIGGALGLLVAREALTVFVKTAPIDLPRVSHIIMDGRVIAFAALVAAGAGLCVALLPAWRIGRGDVQSTLRGGGYGTTDRGGVRVRDHAARRAGGHVGHAARHHRPVRHQLPAPGRRGSRILGRPRPRRRGRADRQPISGPEDARGALRPHPRRRAGCARDRRRGVDVHDAADRRNLGRSDRQSRRHTAIVGKGRARTTGSSGPSTSHARDADRQGAEHRRSRSESSVTPAVISARAAADHLAGRGPDRSAVHARQPDAGFEVVGVVADGHPTALETESPLMVYVPYWYKNEGKSVLVVRTPGDAAALAGELAASFTPSIPTSRSPTSARSSALSTRRSRIGATRCGCSPRSVAVAFLIATVGVYATTAYGVSRRRREMNIRVALGARASQVFALVVRQSAAPLFAGIAIGCAGALAAGTVVASLLFKVRATDPVVIASVVGLVGAVGVGAAAVAARQGLRIDPAAALRDD